MNFRKFYTHFPMLILVVEWILVIYLHYSNPYHFITMSKDTLGIVLTGLVFIILGYYFMHSFYLKNDDKLPGDKTPVVINEVFIGKSILVLSLIVLIGLLIISREIAKITNNFSMYFENPFMVRERIVSLGEGKIPGVSMGMYRIGSYFGTLIYPLSFLGGVIMTQRSKWRYTGLIPFLLIVFYSIMNLNRFGLVTSMGLWFFALIYFGMYVEPRRRKHMTVRTGLYIVLAVVFVAVFFITIIKWRSFSLINIEYFAKRSMYSYFTGSGAAFEKFLFNGFDQLYGASGFRSIVKWFAKLGLMDSGMVMGAHNSFFNISRGIPMSLNTYTFAKSPYEDFGIIGVGIISLLWGGLSRYAMERCFRQFSLMNLFYVSILTLSLLMTFYEFFFQSITMFIYWFVILKLIENYFVSKGVIKPDAG